MDGPNDSGGLGPRAASLRWPAAAAVATLVAGGLVWGASQAAFTATTATPGNQIVSGTVALTDDAPMASGLVVEGELAPGARGSRCVEVTYLGTVPAAVTLFAPAGGGDLAPWLDLTVVEGRGGGAGDCAGFTPAAVIFSGTVADLVSDPATATAPGVGFFAAGGPAATRTYRLDWEVSDDLPDTGQSDSGAVDLTWLATGSTEPVAMVTGHNSAGKLGLGDTAQRTALTALNSPATTGTWTQLASSGRHSCGIRHPGTLWCWGSNSAGALGLGAVAGPRVPARVGAASDWTQVATGWGHTCGLRGDGVLWCWGTSSEGELGLNGFGTLTTPMQVENARWADLTAGYLTTCGVQVDGSLWCWGAGQQGQLGLGDISSYPRAITPARVGGDTDWVSVSTQEYNTCGVRGDGSLWCWGQNAQGQAGLGDQSVRISPERVGDGRWVDVEVGLRHTCAISHDGGLWCAGSGDVAQLGNGVEAARPSFVQVGTDHDWAQLTTSDHTCGIRQDRTLWCWGDNVRGTAGAPTPTTILTPTQVPGGTSVAHVSRGEDTDSLLVAGFPQ